MAESIFISSGTGKEEKYQQLLPQVAVLTSGESDLIANLANITAALKYGMGFFWVGFYLVSPTPDPSPKGSGIPAKKELVLGPFQGPVACTRIGYGKGVCGTCWKEETTIIVEDVDKFPGHIACSAESKSEIVLPVFNRNKEVVMVLDIDSDTINNFDTIDKYYLMQVVNLIENKL